MMRIIDDTHSLDAYFNLAAEEYLLNNSKENICRIWRNENAVIIGKHQALPVEVNTKASHEKGVQVARRISGGGTVYHDLGNLNFTFVFQNEKGKNWINFNQFTIPVLEALHEQGVPALKNERNDILIDGKKVSGNAEHLSQKLNKTIHHGTLLFNSNLGNLGDILKTRHQSFEGKFVQSKRSKVGNISDFMSKTTDLHRFRGLIVESLLNRFSAQKMDWTQDEIDQIEHLAQSKYRLKEWIYGYSPKFTYTGNLEGVPLQVRVEKGKIVEIDTEHSLKEILYSSLEGLYFDFEEVKAKLEISSFTKSQKQATIHCLFSLY